MKHKGETRSKHSRIALEAVTEALCVLSAETISIMTKHIAEKQENLKSFSPKQIDFCSKEVE